MKNFIKLVVFASFILFMMSAEGAGLEDYAGNWVMRLDGRNLFVLTLKKNGNGLQGNFDRPAKLFVNNSIFSVIRNGVRHDKVVSATLEKGELHLVIQNADDHNDTNNLGMSVQGSHATLSVEGLPPGLSLGPWQFDRTGVAALVSTDWEINRSYVVGDSDKSNVVMLQLYTDDQKDRAGQEVNWKTVNRADSERREKTKKLLMDGALHTGKDYEEAAFIFQHGDSSDDYLLAHILAVISISKGDPTAIWIASASLDRYLQKIGQKQVMGTQFTTGTNNAMTQEPYDKKLISDALRQQLGVPPLAAQSDQLRAYQK